MTNKAVSIKIGAEEVVVLQNDTNNVESKKTKIEDSITENDTISQIFDKLFKRMLSLSRSAVIAFINGLFSDNFPTESEVTFNSTEHVNSKYRRTISELL